MQSQLQSQPEVKKMELSYGVDKVLNEYLPTLEHKSNGLIFTCVETPYIIGTDETLYTSLLPNCLHL
ncbi:hypothetical protein BKA62DRAFT_800648 [Auriculariales sp. MPI-PUGE-AT-0066]|nr:hypothetical protein BKA62DRAFT_800648 [Auriculariales sp. MPI-PUGE-AT-0066]